MATVHEARASSTSTRPTFVCLGVALRSGWYALSLLRLSVVALLVGLISFLRIRSRRNSLGPYGEAFQLTMIWSRIYGRFLSYLESLSLQSEHDDSLRSITMNVSLMSLTTRLPQVIRVLRRRTSLN